MDVLIDSLAAGGDGVGRAPDGRVVFVPFTAPGDRVRVRVAESRARFLRATVETLLAPGAARTDPVCPVFGSCGGCSWQHVEISAQLDAKVKIVEDAIQRIGGLAFGGRVEITPSPDEYGYRARTRLLRSRGRIGYRRRRSHAVQAVSRCPVLTPELDAELHALSESAGVSESAGAPEAEIELGAAEILVLGDRLRVSEGVFFQANAGLHDALASAVLAAAGSGERVLELFAGAGFFTLGLSRRFERVTAVESSPAAAGDLRQNLERAGLGNVEVVAERLEDTRLAPAEVLLLDPPRAGLPPGSVTRLAALGARRIVYLSCDPATLARDCAEFAREGYALRDVSAFDLFPQTPHVEVLVRMEPQRGRDPAGSVHSEGGISGAGSGGSATPAERSS